MPPASRDAKVARAELGVGLLVLASFLFFAFRARFPIPYRDDWDWLGWLLTRPLTLRTLFEPHNEHMIPLPRLLVELQYGLEGSGTHLVFAVALISQLALAWIFLREIVRRFPTDAFTREFAIGAVAICLFFNHQLQSFVFMAAVLFPLVQTFAVMAIVFALNATDLSQPGLTTYAKATAVRRSFMRRRKTRPTSGNDRPTPGHDRPTDGARSAWLWAGVAAACAGLTTTNGIIAPIIVALLIWVRRGSQRAAIAFALAGAAGLVMYVLLVGRPWAHAPAPAGAAWSVPPVGELVSFFLAFFASALAYGSVKAAVVLGSALFVLGCLSIGILLRERESARRIELFAVGVMLFATASAAMATPARAQFGAVQAAQSRYASYAMAYDAALLLWCLSRVSGSEWWRRRKTVVAIATVLASIALLAAHIFIGQVWIAKAENIAFVRYALAARVNDDEWIATLHPVTSIVYDTTERLRTDGDRQLIDARLGEPWRQPARGDACSGTLALQNLGERTGWRVIGTLATQAASGVIVDRSLTVRGFAAQAPLVETANPIHAQEVVDVVWRSYGRDTPTAPSWLGFAQKGDGAPYKFYALSSDGSPVCQAAISTVPEPIRMYLDGPLGDVTGTATGGGWAFQCEGSVERLRVFVDDVEQSVSVVRGVSRPDVRNAFANRCDVAEGSGFSFQLNARELSAGRHRVRVAADDSVGRTVESNTTEIVVR